MNSPGALVSDIRELLGSLHPRRRLQLLALAALMLFGAIAEVLSLGAIVPFLAVLIDPVQALQKPFISKVVSILGPTDAGELRLRLTLVFGAAAIVAGAIRFGMIYATARLNYAIGHELASEVYRRTLCQTYEVHVARNSSELMVGINKVDTATYVLLSILNTYSACIMALFIVGTLMLIDPIIAASAMLGFGGIYAGMSLLTRKRLEKNSQVIGRSLSERLQCVQEGLGGIRDVLLDHSQALFVARFKEVDWPLRWAQASNNTIGPGPRFLVEALGMVLIATIAYALTSSEGSVGTVIPTLGALALGAQRLLPLLQQAYQGWVTVMGERRVLSDVVGLLRQAADPVTTQIVPPLSFEREIRFENVSFQYQSDLPKVLHELNLSIQKGTRVGIIGPTGSGKSTAMDLLLGLLQPTRGNLIVDGVPVRGSARLSWQRNIAHVPQAIFLTDASFMENIAFGVKRELIDEARVRKAAHQAQIHTFIESQPKGYSTPVGERGVRISGGQRQRIGIARALYRDANVLVFDEATSALDSETEAAVMQAIESLGRDLTIVLIAHRVTTLRGCDVIYRLHAGRIRSSGTYESEVASG